MGEKERELFELFRSQSSEEDASRTDREESEPAGATCAPAPVVSSAGRRTLPVVIGVVAALCITSGYVGWSLRGTGGAPAPEPGPFRIRVVTYDRSESGRRMARRVADHLLARGFPEVAVEETGASDLVVYLGSFGRRQDPTAERWLEMVRREELDGRAPFRSALIVRRP
jgi:hypothetical protein